MSDNNDLTNEEADDKHEDELEDSVKKNLHRQHDSGAADLEKVTDYAEEKELSSHASASAINLVEHKKIQEEKLKRENELAKIIIRKEDVELICSEMEVTKQIAERRLREHHGDAKETLRAMIAVPGL